MRLTAEGKLGIGVSEPQAKLDVAGLIRTAEGIVFPDGTVQTTAYVASGRTLSERAGLQRDMQGRQLEGRVEDGSRAAPTGPKAALATAGRLSKFADAAGNLTDSGVLETLAGGGMVQTFGNTGATGGAFNHVVEIVAGSGKTPLTLVGGAGAMEFWRDSTPTSAIAFGVAKPALPAVPTDDMVFSTYAQGSGWFERMRLTNSGNVGIGTPMPNSKLEIAAQDGLAITGFQPFLTLRDTSASNKRSVIQGFSGGLTFFPESFIGGNAAMYLQNSTGNLGIGTSTPGYKLDVNGIGRFQGMELGPATGAGVEIQYGPLGGANRGIVFAYDRATNSPKDLLLNHPGGNVGIGTSSPGFKLDVADRMRVKKGASASAGIWFNQNTVIDQAFLGMQDDTHIGFFGVGGANWGMTMDTTNGNLAQRRDSGGLVKAMVYFDPFINQNPPSNQKIVRCYNSQPPSITPDANHPCGFTSTYLGLGTYFIDFGFDVSDRFIVATPVLQVPPNRSVTVQLYVSPDDHRRVIISAKYSDEFLTETDNAFYLIVY